MGDKVLVKTHLIIQAAQGGIISKFLPPRYGPYTVHCEVSPTPYEHAELKRPEIIIGKYHTSQLTPLVCRL